MPRPSLDGCMRFGCLALCLAAIVTVPMYCAHRSGKGDDPYFHATSCTHGHRSDQVSITSDGLSPTGCSWTDGQSFRFVNRLPYDPVTLCLGRHAACDTGHFSPFEGGRVTLPPGGSREVRFPYHRSWWWYDGVPRNYPVTMLPVPGLSFGETDIVLRREVPVKD